MSISGISDPKTILVTRLRFIGDVVLTIPVVRALRQQFPDARIYYLAERAMGAILEGDPDLDGVLSYDGGIGVSGTWYERFMCQIKFLKILRSHNIDIVIDLFCNPRSALLTLLSGASIRVGYDVRIRGAVYNVKIRRSGSIKVSEAYLDGIRALGMEPETSAPNLILSPAELSWAEKWFYKHGLSSDEPVVCVNPGASWPAKTWPGQSFATLCDRLIQKAGVRIVFIQGPSNSDQVCAVIEAMIEDAILVEYHPIRQISALISRCQAMVSNDSGPMHIGPAVATPTVGIFGPSDSSIWFPYDGTIGHSAIKPDVARCCGNDVCTEASPCINGISVTSVFEAVARILAGQS
ncbi:MAG: glycosyltransferase family 9 protein [Candidatus Latescibacteria bacterium]|jgi:lipopolysaccharide heptosyltransferase II|nr:glycosyltransferase family 9 protein [Candidatus Latescibacterota bacterium]